PGAKAAGTNRGGFLKPTDGGRNWLPASSGLRAVGVNALTVDASAPGTIYLGSVQGNVTKTTDGGKTWTRRGEGMETTDVRSIANLPDAPKILIAGADEGIYRSENAGESWTLAHKGDFALYGGVQAIAFDGADPATVYARDAETIYKSTDRGKSWTVMPVKLEHGGTLTGLFGFAAVPGSAGTL